MNKAHLDPTFQAEKSVIGPLTIERLRNADTLQLVRASVERRLPLEIAICNAHTTLTALDDPEYAAILQQMTLLNDGIGIDWASRYLAGEGFPDNLNGTDLIPRLLAGIGIPLRIYLLGASEHHVQCAKQHIELTYPSHRVVGCRNGYFDMSETADLCLEINRTEPDLLLVGMGNPRQEVFIVQNRAKLDVTVAIGVGALFDFMSGSVIRAPKVMQSVGLEWLFRLLQEPRRLFRRYVIGIPRFIFGIWRLKRQQKQEPV